jgi:pilus assembly protein FimV
MLESNSPLNPLICMRFCLVDAVVKRLAPGRSSARGRAALLAGLASLAIPVDASAISLGRVRSAITLGQPLSVAVPVVLEDGDVLEPQCVRAEVMHGDAMWPGQVIRVRITPGNAEASRVLRVTSTVTVDEPVLVITVHVGCPTRFSRAYTVLADPPIALATASPREDDTANQAETPRNEAAVAPPVAKPRIKVAPRKRLASPKGKDTNAAGARSKTVAPAAADKREPNQAPSTPLGERATANASGSRLQLDAGSVSYSQAVMEAAQAEAKAAAASAKAAQEAVAAAEKRVRLLELEITKLREDAKAQLDATLALKAQLSTTQQQAAMLPWLLGLALLSAGVAVWLATRVRRLSRTPRNDWAMSAKASAQSPETHIDSKLDASLGPAASDRVALATPAAGLASGAIAKAAASAQAAAPSTVLVKRPTGPSLDRSMDRPSERAAAMAEAQRAVTVDEQIDLEQEADFFIALGHDDAAIDLLLAHLRTTGGSVPMPYLKLLELYRRRGDRDDYELMRRRFNQRFNSVAPDWDHDPTAGKLLEDYPERLAALQRVWSRPIDAMATLEAMAFGRREDQQEVIDLPAYQEVLMLYQIARSLRQDVVGDGTGESDVDVLLPLAGDDDTPPPPPAATLGAQPALQMVYRPTPTGELPMIDIDILGSGGSDKR